MLSIVDARQGGGSRERIGEGRNPPGVGILHGEGGQQPPRRSRMSRGKGQMRATESGAIPNLGGAGLGGPPSMEPVFRGLDEELGQTPRLQAVSRSTRQARLVFPLAKRPKQTRCGYGHVAVADRLRCGGPHPRGGAVVLGTPGLEILVERHQSECSCHGCRREEGFAVGPEPCSGIDGRRRIRDDGMGRRVGSGHRRRPDANRVQGSLGIGGRCREQPQTEEGEQC